MAFFTDSLPIYLNGAWYTLMITVGGCALAFVLSMVVGIIGSMRSALARVVATVYVEVFRGVAALVLMFWLFYAMPLLIGYRMEPVLAAILALGLNVGAYGAENVRGAIKAVPRGQYEATIALNFEPVQRMRLVILPQAWAQMLPTFGNLIIELMKGSAVVSLISVSDLTFVASRCAPSRSNGAGLPRRACHVLHPRPGVPVPHAPGGAPCQPAPRPRAGQAGAQEGGFRGGRLGEGR